METKEYNAISPEQENAPAQAVEQELPLTPAPEATQESPAPEPQPRQTPPVQTPPIQRAPRTSGVRSRARRQALLDAAVLFVQQALLCPAIAANIACQDRTALCLEFGAAVLMIAVLDFFFGGFFSRRTRPLYRGGLHAALFFLPVFFGVGLPDALLTLGLTVLAQAALYAVNARAALTTARGSCAGSVLRVLAAAILALALRGMSAPL